MGDQEIVYAIVATGTKQVISEEPVLDGLTRPLVVQYSCSLGIVNENWDYVRDSAMTPWWGAINGVTYELVQTGSAE